ncbi:MAG: glycosyl transferase family 2 [Candidatus Thermoplasmatota archaeon]|nr:glycosyl transferase family 2 [Candidatus Thermoplasmatota archaeon]
MSVHRVRVADHPGLDAQVRDIASADIVVGILCKNVAATILHVLNAVSQGLHQYFPAYKTVMAVIDGFSTDRTVDLAHLFQPHNGISKIVTSDLVRGGKGGGVRTVVEIAHELQAKSLVLLDGDLLSIRPEWLQEFSYPVLCGRADLVVPYYIRHKFDGVITNALAYPFTRALYGLDVRQPIAGEFGLSRELYERMRSHPLFPADFGIDIFIVTTAAAEGMNVKEGIYSLKIHESTTRYLEPEELLVPMFRQVTGQMLEMASHYQSHWRNHPPPHRVIAHKECFAQNPVPVKVDLDRLRFSFQQEFAARRPVMAGLLPPEMMRQLEAVAAHGEPFTSRVWAECVAHLTFAYLDCPEQERKEAVLEALKALWLGRFVSYAVEAALLSMNEAEAVVQRQARIFEEVFARHRALRD